MGDDAQPRRGARAASDRHRGDARRSRGGRSAPAAGRGSGRGLRPRRRRAADPSAAARRAAARADASCSASSPTKAKTASQFVHPVVRAILLHFWLAYDHPFEDGNGRTARILFFWLMRAAGLLARRVPADLSIHPRSPGAVRAGLHRDRDRRAATPPTSSSTSSRSIEKAIDDLHVYLQRKIAEVRDVERLLHGADGLNHRQLALLTDAVRHPDGVLHVRQPRERAIESPTRRRAPTSRTSPSAGC